MEPYVLLNGVSVLSYFYTRKNYLDLSLLESTDLFGYSRELSIAAVFAIIVIVRYKNYQSVKHFVISLIYYAKILVAVLIGITKNYPILALYIFGFIVLWFILEIPKYKGPSKMLELSNSTFTALFDPKSRQESLKSERYVFCVFYADFSFNSTLVSL